MFNITNIGADEQKNQLAKHAWGWTGKVGLQCGAEASALGSNPAWGWLTDFSPGSLGEDVIKANFRQMQKTKSQAFLWNASCLSQVFIPPNLGRKNKERL